MGSTLNGLPYPSGTDFLVDGDNSVKALAEAVDGNWVGGQFDAATDAAGQFRIITPRLPRTIVVISRIVAARWEFVVSGFDAGGAILIVRDLSTGAPLGNGAVAGYYMALLKVT